MQISSQFAQFVASGVAVVLRAHVMAEYDSRLETVGLSLFPVVCCVQSVLKEFRTLAS